MTINDTKYIFIVGVGRSGTTLVQHMLNAHPEISFPPETHFFRMHIINGRFEKLLKKHGRKGLVNVLKKDQYLKRLELEVEQILERLNDNNNKISAIEFYKNILRTYATRQGKKIFGDKDPRCIEFIPSLYKFFPHSYLIHVIRDPRDVIVSRMNASWSMGRNILHHIFAYRVQFQLGRELGNKFYKERYFEIVYEDLLANPINVIKKLCSFIDIPYSQEMMNFGDHAKKIVSNEEMQWKKEALGPLLTKNYGKWKSALSNIQVAKIERLCYNVFSNPGYIKTNVSKDIGLLNRFYLSLISALFIIFTKIYKLWRQL